MKMRVLAAIVLGCVFYGNSMPANSSRTVVVSNFEASNAAWTQGTLRIVLRDGRPILTLDYSMPNGHLNEMRITTRNWTADLSPMVSALPIPFPARTQIFLENGDANHNPREFHISVPYSTEENLCRSLEMDVKDGRVISSNPAPAASVRCEP